MDPTEDAARRRFAAASAMPGSTVRTPASAGNLCRGSHRSIARFTGQNGKVLDAKPELKARCGKGKGKGRGH